MTPGLWVLACCASFVAGAWLFRSPDAQDDAYDEYVPDDAEPTAGLIGGEPRR